MVLVLVIIAAFFEKQISDRLVKEINNQITTELTVGEFNLNLLSGFPSASADLHNVTLDDAMNGTLLEAEKLSFQFGLFSLFSSNIKVNSVVIEDGSLYIKTDKKGRVNYNVLLNEEPKTKQASVENSEFGLSLDEAKLNRVELIYVDERLKQYAKMHVRKLVASGEFSSDKFSLTSFADMKTHFVETDKERSLENKDVVYDAKIDVDFVNDRYGFEDVSFGVGSNVFNVNGFVEQGKDFTNYDLELNSTEGSLASLLELLPPEQQKYFSDFESKGTFHFDSTIKGKQTKYKDPAIEFQVSLENGKISSAKLDDDLKDVHFTAKFSNGKERNNKNAIFEISDFKGYFNRELIEGKLKITNLDQPYINFNIDGVLPMESVYGLFNSKNITGGDGEVEFKNIQLKGRYKDMVSTYGIGRVDTKGEIEFDDAELTINKKKVILDKGLLSFQDNNMKVDDVVLEAPGTEIELNGNFLNILPVLFADSLNSKKAELKFNAKLHASKLDLDELMKLSSFAVEENEVSEEVYDSLQVAKTQERERITKFLKGTFKANIDEFNYEKIEASDFNGTLTFDNNEMAVKGKVKTMEGRMIIDGTTFFEDKPFMKAKLTCEQLNLREFFRQTENFGQEVMVYKNVRGGLDAKFLINAFWDEEANFQTDKLHVLGDIAVQNGELVNFKMLYDFSDYIHLNDLKKIKFTDLHNYMEIKKSKLYIPAMFLQSNAMNLTVSGTHSFENKIDYNIKVNAGQVVANKLKGHDASLKPQKAKKKGWFNLYYRIYGPMEKYKYGSDKKRVKKSLANSEVSKKRIQRALRNEFGNIISAEEPTAWKDKIQEYVPEGFEESDGTEEEEFIEWDESSESEN